jgi:parvulin-like peptidyl-prolyl isomerase
MADAQAALRGLQSGKSDAMTFAALRKQYGADEMNRDLELKYWSEEELRSAFGEELAKAIFSVQQMGELGPVVKGESGFYVFKLTGKRAAYHRPVQDVAGIIKQKLARQSRNALFETYIDRLRSTTDVKIDEPALAKILGP